MERKGRAGKQLERASLGACERALLAQRSKKAVDVEVALNPAN